MGQEFSEGFRGEDGRGGGRISSFDPMLVWAGLGLGWPAHVYIKVYFSRQSQKC